MQKSKKLLIVGNSEIAAMAFEYFDCDSPYEVVAFSIGAEYITEPRFCNRPVVPSEEADEHYPPSEVDAFVAIGNLRLNRVRREQFALFKAKGYHLATYVSSRASVWRNATIGENCFILEDNILQPFVAIGNNVVLWSGNHIGHRTVIEDDVFVASHVVISGYCRIGRSSFLGVNVAVGDNVTIGEDNFLSLGVNISKSTAANLVWTPASAEASKVPATRFCRVQK